MLARDSVLNYCQIATNYFARFLIKIFFFNCLYAIGTHFPLSTVG